MSLKYKYLLIFCCFLTTLSKKYLIETDDKFVTSNPKSTEEYDEDNEGNDEYDEEDEDDYESEYVEIQGENLMNIKIPESSLEIR